MTTAETVVGFDPSNVVPEPNSWVPVDLGPYLRGEITRPEPTVGLPRTDGLRLVYPGKEHTCIGEMEAGKSWFALGCAAAEINTGNHVVYLHFEEADPGDTVERLSLLGVPDREILRLFHFVGPERRSHLDDLDALLDPVPSLAVLDGVNEAMSLHGCVSRDDDGAATFRRLLVKPFTRVGAATLGLDHVVKDPERRTRSPIGSVHKGNGITGSLIELVNAEPFGRGRRGRSHVYINKDRPGHLRRNGRPHKTLGVTYMGELVLDDTRSHYPLAELILYAPKQEDETDTGAGDATSDRDKVYAAVTTIIAAGEEANVTRIRGVAGLRGTGADDALAALVFTDRRLTEKKGKRNARIFVPTTLSLSQDQADG